MADNLEQIVGFDNLTKQVKGFQDSPTFKLLKTMLHKTATEYYHSEDGAAGKELLLNEKKSKELAGILFDVAAKHIAVNYLKLNEDQIKQLKEIKDPANGKTQWESFIREHLGADKDSIYEAIKTRGIIKPEEIDSLISPIYQAHAQVATTKMLTSKIDTIEKAQALMNYIKDLKGQNPKTFEGLTIPTIKSAEEAQRFYAGVIPGLSKDYVPNIADKYRKAA